MSDWFGEFDDLSSPAAQLFAAVFMAVMLTRLFRFFLAAVGLGS